MERLNKAQAIKVGTKFDQPGFGLKGLSGKPEGFDVEIAKIIAKELGIPTDKIEYIETPSKVREDVIVNGTVDFVVATYTINDKRKERIDVRRAVLRGRPEHHGEGGRHHDHRAGLVQGRHQEGLLGHRLDAGREHQEVPSRTSPPSWCSSTPTTSAWTPSRAARSTRSPPTTSS